MYSTDIRTRGLHITGTRGLRNGDYTRPSRVHKLPDKDQWVFSIELAKEKVDQRMRINVNGIKILKYKKGRNEYNTRYLCKSGFYITINTFII